MKKIAVITGSRADSSPIAPVIKELQKYPDCHLSHFQTHGLYNHENTIRVLCDHPSSRPDVVILFGDRYETLVAASVCSLLAIPIIHFHGGEDTAASVDDYFRNAISKLSYYHFPCHQKYADRLMTMGESDDRIFIYGAPGIDRLAETPFTKEECEKELGIRFEGRIALCCYHPETLGDDEYNINLLQHAIYKYDTLIISGANADKGGERINAFWSNYSHRGIFRDSYSSHLWVSLMHHADVLIGNSSGFIFEGMTLEKPIIMIGERQEGRYEDAVEFFRQEKFPFGEPGKISSAIAKKIMELDFPKMPRKQFYG